MTYHEDLLQLANELVRMNPDAKRQACYRRSISTAYYALFHLLIDEATLNWIHPNLRAQLGRVFEHAKMKSASSRQSSAILEANKKSSPSADTQHLLFVADSFVKLQHSRQQADYDVSKQWSQTDVQNLIDEVSEAFVSWAAIRDTPAAQAYLVSLLGTRPRAD